MKETYVGGDIIETTGGNNLLYAEGNIENSGDQVIQNGKTNGVFMEQTANGMGRSKL